MVYCGKFLFNEILEIFESNNGIQIGCSQFMYPYKSTIDDRMLSAYEMNYLFIYSLSHQCWFQTKF